MQTWRHNALTYTLRQIHVRTCTCTCLYAHHKYMFIQEGILVHTSLIYTCTCTYFVVLVLYLQREMCIYTLVLMYVTCMYNYIHEHTKTCMIRTSLVMHNYNSINVHIYPYRHDYKRKLSESAERSLPARSPSNVSNKVRQR